MARAPEEGSCSEGILSEQKADMVGGSFSWGGCVKVLYAWKLWLARRRWFTMVDQNTRKPEPLVLVKYQQWGILVISHQPL